MYHPFSIADTISTAWSIIKRNFVTIIVYSTLVVVLLGVIQAVNFIYSATSDLTLQLILFFLLLLMQGYTTLGLYKLIFTLIDSEYYEFEFSQLIPKIRMVLSYIAISLIFAFIVTTYNFFVVDKLINYPATQAVAQFVGVVTLLYLALRFMFCVCFIVDEDSGPFESLGQSFVITKGNITKIILILLISIGLIFLGLAALFVGLIITYPLVNIILVVTYRKLVYSHQDVDDDLSETN
ncbi:glycerophosphoryl diester phosphodiesterase membrane domain-containing protein [Mucilaginibacter myungsuensis]|uniref:Glycerophosphoryl diester phosphodiesterase membrane domain-containing protein n=1 Tax=Mucilaginibacter myungsuensis TaxID=649104 RepID=A0A929KYB2_9SPHI|nr:glycerophosphoryl diester phosphodiesterase membrane domain-containing protein [Mucilaginibacter myungsuensis]MBE9660855.1 glycerophosphoryl diester phosphodiesterase membrane domain-containing protein [Mucilaginibacter myungsuensis]MDN3600902.1 glycerophosphoryl diester phosphodiesterase membrane domain-containing protein [Mucilaginibacter myungsuensis]